MEQILLRIAEDLGEVKGELKTLNQLVKQDHDRIQDVDKRTSSLERSRSKLLGYIAGATGLSFIAGKIFGH